MTMGDYGERAPKKESINCRLVKWEEIQTWSEAVARKVRDAKFAPDVVIGITRGGWVPARIICDVLGVKSLFSMKTEHWGVTAAKDGQAKLVAKPETDLKGKRVLMVDDITDTGASLKLAVDWVGTQGPKEVRVATLLHITHSQLVPEFYSVEVPKEKWAWFIFPWNRHEDIRTLLPKTLHTSQDADGISGAFREQFNIEVDGATIRQALEDLAKTGTVRKSGAQWALKGK